MRRERWEQVSKVFHAALAVAPEERADFLRATCADDAELRHEVESLLAAGQETDHFLSGLRNDEAEALAREASLSLVGQTLSHYRVLSLLGAGGMGEVYLAEDTKLKRKVALKLLPAELIANQDRLRRFEQEALAASALNHPNIITIHEIDETNSTHFIATEFIDGETLRQHSARTRLTAHEAVEIAMQIASALAAAHETGIVHRDIKPDNVMLRRDGIAKVLDFGLAKLTRPETIDPESPTRAQVKTETGLVMGTAIYMSPEQARGMAVDARTDIFSLGVVMYEMVAGCVPFAGSTTSDVLASILNEKEPPPLARFARDVPAELERIVEKALRKDREERYQTAKDLLLDLRRLKQQLDFEAKLQRSTASETSSEEKRLSTSAPSSTEYAVSRIRQHKRGVWLIMAAATIAVAYFVYSRYFAESAKVNFDSQTPVHSIAVLPLTNTNADPETEYLSDGITESLINSLSKLPGMKVIARSSSFKYKGQEVDPHEVARALGVEAILTGRVALRGENLLISVNLMDARDKTQMWGEQFNRQASDLLQVQAEISREIAESLRLRLTAGDQQQLAKRETVNPQAYGLLIKGRSEKAKREFKKALDFYQQAIILDPDYAFAYAELSLCYTNLVSGLTLRPEDGLPKAEAAALRALKLDESLAEAHEAMARVKINAWEWAAAEREYKRALELNSNLVTAHSGYAGYLSFVGRYEQAVTEAKHARDLDPLVTSTLFNLGAMLYNARKFDQAIDELKHMLEMYPNADAPLVFLGYSYLAKGMYLEAIAALQQGMKISGDNTSDQIYIGTAYAKAGQRGKARAILARLETTKEYVSPGELALLYDGLDERDKAFVSLERAYAAHDFQLKHLGFPEYDSLRSDPRFQDILQRVGLPH